MRRSRFPAFWALLIFGQLFAPCIWCADVASSSIPVTVPFELVSGFLVVVDGQVGELGGLRFVLDTGSSYTVIDQRVAEKLRLPRRPGKITNFDRDIPVAWADVHDLHAGPIRSSTASVVIVRLREYSEFGENVDGIIGLDLLSRGKSLTIDYERRVVSFEPLEAGAEERAPSKMFVAPIVVQGVRLRLLVDTGFREMLLYRDRLRELPNVTTVGHAKPAVIGRLQATQVNLPGVKIVGPEQVATVFLINSPASGDPHGVDGYLGPAWLHAKRIELDFAARKLRWE
jgi:predicted aspartyl protease